MSSVAQLEAEKCKGSGYFVEKIQKKAIFKKIYDRGGYVGPFVNLVLIEILISKFSDILGHSLLSHSFIFVLLSLLVLEF